MQDLALFSEFRLPRKPYCTDDPHFGVMVKPLARALTYKHIQLNAPHAISWIVVDIDAPLVTDPISPQMAAIFDGGVPVPNFLAINPKNQHGHAYFALERPVAKGDHASIKALWYASSIEAALIKAFGGDPAYAGFIAKNPIHKAWHRVDFRKEPYTLHELEDYLDLQGPDKSQQRAEAFEQTGIGRNAALFDRLRFHAYQYVKMYKADSSYEAWKRYLAAKADIYNDFHPALDSSEVKHLVQSVAKWTWTKYTGKLCDEQWSALQADRGAKGGRISAKSRAEKAEQSGSSLSDLMSKLSSKGISESEPWVAEGISRATWYRRLKK